MASFMMRIHRPILSSWLPTFLMGLMMLLFAIHAQEIVEELYVEPASHTGPTGQDYKFTCTAQSRSNPPPTLVWQNTNGGDIANESGQFTVMSTKDEAVMKTVSMLTIINAEETDAGTYSCVHQEGSLGQFDGKLDVFDTKVPEIEGDTLIKLGEDLTLTCKITGGQSASSSVIWRKGDMDLPVTSDDSNIEIEANNTLRIMEATNDNAGIYYCVHNYEDGNGAKRTSMANVTIGGGMELEGPKSVKYTEGERARFECKATGSPLPTFTWTKENGTVYEERITISEEEKPSGSGTVIGTLLLEKVNMTDRGNFICTATNGIDTQSHEILLRVRDRLAALWPFIGIMTEVIILIAIIFIHEKCTQGEDLGEDDDDEAMEPIKGGLDEKAASDGEDAVRMRASKE